MGVTIIDPEMTSPFEMLVPGEVSESDDDNISIASWGQAGDIFSKMKAERSTRRVKIEIVVESSEDEDEYLDPEKYTLVQKATMRARTGPLQLPADGTITELDDSSS